MEHKLMHQIVARLVRVICRIMLMLVMIADARFDRAVMRVRVRDIQGSSDKEKPKENRSNGDQTMHDAEQ